MTTQEQFELPGPVGMLPSKQSRETEYIIVADTNGVIISSHTGPNAFEVLEVAQSLAKKIRAANGEVTIFKRTEY